MEKSCYSEFEHRLADNNQTSSEDENGYQGPASFTGNTPRNAQAFGRGAGSFKLAAARAQAESARANHEKSTYELKRFQVLAEKNAVSGQQLDHARTQKEMTDAQIKATTQEAQALRGEIDRIIAQKEAASAALAEARTVLTHTLIYAPFDGRLLKKLVNVGDLASPGPALFLTESDS